MTIDKSILEFTATSTFSTGAASGYLKAVKAGVVSLNTVWDHESDETGVGTFAATLYVVHSDGTATNYGSGAVTIHVEPGDKLFYESANERWGGSYAHKSATGALSFYCNGNAPATSEKDMFVEAYTIASSSGGTEDKNLLVNGTSTLNGDTTVDGDLTVKGNTQLGDSVSDTTGISGNATVGKDLSVAGNETVNGNEVIRNFM